MEGRQKYNKLILKELEKIIDKYPNLRFGQILCNTNILQYKNEGIENIPVVLDPFYDESKTIWKRILSIN